MVLLCSRSSLLFPRSPLPSPSFQSLPPVVLRRRSHLFSPPHQRRPLTLTTRAAATTEASSSIDRFCQWMEKGGASSSSSSSPVVKVASVDEGLGLVAQRDIPAGETVVEVPKKLWINSDTVAVSDIGHLCGNLRPWASISLFLLREKGKGEGSLWKPYLDILPPSTHSPLFWSEEELSQLQGTQLLSTTLSVIEYVKGEFLKIEEEIIIPNKKLFPTPISVDDFLWAFGILRSRAFSRLRGENLVLIPLADLTNHSSAITTEDNNWEIKGKGLFSRELFFFLQTPVSVKCGDQVYMQYDLGKNNGEMALDYGIVESLPERNTYTLTLEIMESDPFFGDKLDIAESNSLGEAAYFDVVLGQPLPPKLIPYLRLIAIGGTDAFLLESVFRNKIWDHLELPISRPNEELICQVMRDACKSALSSYNTTIEEDESLMKHGNMEPRTAIAVAIRAGEKKVLQQIDETFQDRESDLDGLEYYQERRLKDLGLCGEQGEIIFWE